MQLSDDLCDVDPLLGLQLSLQEPKNFVVERQFSRELLRAKRYGLLSGRSRRNSVLLASSEPRETKTRPITREVSHKKLRTEDQQSVTGRGVLADGIVSMKLDYESDQASSRRRSRGTSCFFAKAPDSSPQSSEADTNQL